jgi:hypothetical protein
MAWSKMEIRLNKEDSVKKLGMAMWACVFMCAVSARADGIYITGNNGTSLFVINSSNGASTFVGNFGFSVFGDAFRPDGTLYAMIDSGSSGSQLATVNILTGAATPIGSATGVSSLDAIAFTPNGTLYAASFATNDLYTLNLSTGAATVVGNLGFTGVMDLAWDSGNGTMYAIESLGAGSALYSINLSTGTGSLVTTTPGDGCLMGLSIDSANRFLATDYCSSSSPLFQINTTTGALTNLGNTGIANSMGGDVAPIPEPLTAFTLGGGLAFAWLCKKLGKRRFSVRTIPAGVSAHSSPLAWCSSRERSAREEAERYSDPNTGCWSYLW